MILRTDTIGHFENPTAANVDSAIAYAGEGVRENDLVKLMIDESNYLCVWIGNKASGHRLVLRYGSTTVDCIKRLDTTTAVEIMNNYLKGDITWYKNYRWDQPIVQKFIENLQISMQKE
jgi:hypothetical protein